MSALIWEQIDSYHKRARVPGGWLVKAYEDIYETIEGQGLQRGYNWQLALTFVPDFSHTWII